MENTLGLLPGLLVQCPRAAIGRTLGAKILAAMRTKQGLISTLLSVGGEAERSLVPQEQGYFAALRRQSKAACRRIKTDAPDGGDHGVSKSTIKILNAGPFIAATFVTGGTVGRARRG